MIVRVNCLENLFESFPRITASVLRNHNKVFNLVLFSISMFCN